MFSIYGQQFSMLFSLSHKEPSCNVLSMSIRKELDRKIERKKEEITALERSLGEARAYLQALEDTRKMLPKEPGNQEEVLLRPGTELAKVRDILQREGKPLHVEELLQRLGKPPEKKHKLSLSGTLAAYVREHKVFTRPGPNTFGLVEFATPGGGGGDAPPENFGLEDGAALTPAS